VFWKGNGQVTWRVVDRREQTADVAGQEIMTRDKVTLRVNLVVTDQLRTTPGTPASRRRLNPQQQKKPRDFTVLGLADHSKLNECRITRTASNPPAASRRTKCPLDRRTCRPQTRIG